MIKLKDKIRVQKLIEELKSLVDNDFELHRINVLEKDLTAPPTVEIIDDNHQKFDGMLFNKNKGGHFTNHASMHRAVYTYYYGEIPEGYEIHHVNENKADNDISNLAMLTKSEHSKIHNQTAQPVNVKCGYCGKLFQVSKIHKKQARFCSYSCSAKYKRGHFPILKKCQNCNKEFFTTYPLKKFCSAECRDKTISNNRKLIRKKKNCHSAS